MEVQVHECFWELFPDACIEVVAVRGVRNDATDLTEYAQCLANAQQQAAQHVAAEVFTDNPVVADWRAAFRQFKTKKGARSSIEALLKRVASGKEIPPISPLVALYNAVSVQYGVPCGGEDMAMIHGPLRLTCAQGDEPFITLGSGVSEPPYPREVIYCDDLGAVCRCWNWREAQRTMLTEQTTDAVFIIEACHQGQAAVAAAACDALAQQLEAFFPSAAVTRAQVTRSAPSATV